MAGLARCRCVGARRDTQALAHQPKSFWSSTANVDPADQWITAYDDTSPLMALEAELIYATASRGIPWDSALEMELWQIAAALGMHRIETRKDHDAREITEAKQKYWEETKDQRLAKVAGYNRRKKDRARERKQQREAERHAR